MQCEGIQEGKQYNLVTSVFLSQYLEKWGRVEKLSSHTDEKVACLCHQYNNSGWRIVKGRMRVYKANWMH